MMLQSKEEYKGGNPLLPKKSTTRCIISFMIFSPGKCLASTTITSTSSNTSFARIAVASPSPKNTSCVAATTNVGAEYSLNSLLFWTDFAGSGNQEMYWKASSCWKMLWRVVAHGRKLSRHMCRRTLQSGGDGHHHIWWVPQVRWQQWASSSCICFVCLQNIQWGWIKESCHHK